MAGRSTTARYREPVAARSRSAATPHDRGNACPAATNDRTFAALGIRPKDELALDALRGKPLMPCGPGSAGRAGVPRLAPGKRLSALSRSERESMSGFVCACASEVCALIGCQRAQAVRDSYLAKRASLEPVQPLRQCMCVGPQNGQPLCPCRMREVVVKNGRYVRPEQDLGAV